MIVGVTEHGDIFCPACLAKIREESPDMGISEYDYSQCESDGPEHCSSMETCEDPFITESGSIHGCFLENNLTSYGYEYVKGLDKSEVADMWKDFYDIDTDEDDDASDDDECDDEHGYTCSFCGRLIYGVYACECGHASGGDA